MTSQITVDFVRSLNRLAIGAKEAVVKPNELESALHRPLFSAKYKEPMPSAEGLAAELAYGIIMNHPFADGNKRTAFLVSNEYLREKKAKPFADKEPEDLATDANMMAVIGDAHSRVAENKMSVDELGEFYVKILSEL
ncbi:hypothetical protein NLJ89_g1567 [Agrocybe chaxingu]|uniref:Fido domain-containing protein n=1 Tax=Agrocybe chaxingu TaxID=84603 RepID=A0A9W8MZS3_9AGAR|nr:hypothetical protein NLJ89_g1567 [Agrocybe chaxingu]